MRRRKRPEMRRLIEAAIDKKTWDGVFDGTQRHVLLRNDHNFKVGDLLILQSSTSFDRCTVKVTSITSSQEPCAVSKQALHPAYCILSVDREWI